MKEIELSRPVWIIDEEVVGNLISEGVHASTIEWIKDGIYYKEMLIIEEYNELEDLGFPYEIDGE
jgi:hypothetical protein